MAHSAKFQSELVVNNLEKVAQEMANQILVLKRAGAPDTAIQLQLQFEQLIQVIAKLRELSF